LVLDSWLHVHIISPYLVLDFMGFNGFEMPGLTTHYLLGNLVVHAFIGHAMGYIDSSHLCLHLNIVFGWLESHKGYTLRALSIITRMNWSLTPLFIAPHVVGFVTYPQNELSFSRCVHRWSQRFPPSRGVDSSLPVLVQRTKP
jgi:hypothetical protein